MNGKPTPRRVKAFRITDRQGRIPVKCIVIEDVDRGWFITTEFSGRGPYTRAIKPIMDRLDAWNVLNRLRDDNCFPDGPTEMPPDDSIDAAVEQPIARIRKHFHGKVPDWAKQRPPIDQQSGAVVIGLSRKVSSGEEFKQLQQDVWDFASGLELRWKRARRTPAGRLCDVLTFSGSDEVLVTPTGLRVSLNRK
ncbi:MAG TPA: hypothetical protein VKJ45_11130 [Blastocatellia bacterium]|nr:hypothetical protein [Blastocatellia bacterium]